MADERPPSPDETPKPSEGLEIEDDVLGGADADADADDIVSAPTEEHPAPEGATELEGGEEEPEAEEEPDDDGDEGGDDDLGDGDGDDGDEEGDDGDEGGDEEDDGDDEDEPDAEADADQADADDAETDVDGDEDEEEDGEEADQATGVLAAVTSRLPKIPRRGGGSSGGKGAQVHIGRPRRRFPLWARFITGSMVVVLAIAAATAASLLLYLNGIADALGHNGELAGLKEKLPEPTGGAETIMIIGSDKRPDEIKAGENGRSDTTILLRLDPDRKAISLFSIPRDLIVNIPGYGTGMFNAAYSYGGPELTLDTVKALTGLEINHVVNINFRGFARAVQAIGCVYVDVDRRYYHSNQGLPASEQYAEIDVRPGYQRLCGYQALQYVRYRHGDNDIVRSARQQDFLREARARVPADKLFSDRKDLIKIFTDYTTSDINDVGTMLEVLKLIISARSEPVKEVHFEGVIGNRVTTTPAEIKTAVNQFLGVKGTAGPRGSTTAPPGGVAPPPETPPAPKVSKSEQKAAAKSGAAKPKKPSPSAQGLEGGTYGKKLAYRIRRRNQLMPIYYPTTVVAGSEYAAAPRAYNLKDHSLQPNETFSYKFVLRTPDDQYYGLQGTRWKDAPILDEPHETKKVGDRTYNFYYDNDRLRMVSWENNDAVYWVSNSLLEGLSADQMLAIARGTKLLPGPTGE
jgi:LCP family protein required for cell wall assembly